MRTINALLFLATAVATGCVADDDEGLPDEVREDWHTGGKGDGRTCDFAALSAQAYFEQFAYATIDEGTGRPWYRVTTQSWDIVPTLDDGNGTSLTVFFLPDNRVIAEYSEQKSLGGGQSEVLNKTLIVTRATIDPTTRAISIAGVGAGAPVTLTGTGGCRPGYTFAYTGDLRSPGLQGDATTIGTALSTRWVIDPDNLDAVPSETARRWFQEDVASGKIKILRF